MKKLDRRIVRTRQALADALITLALERGYEKLTIRSVTERAGVGYRTFYRHYLSLDDLLAKVLQNAYRKLVQRVAEQKTLHGESLALYTFIREHQPVMRVYVALPREHPARQQILSDVIKIMFARCVQRNTTSVPLEVSIEHLLMATNNMVAWYLDHIDDYTPKQAAVIHDDLVRIALEHLALDLRDDWLQKRRQIP